MTTPQATDLLAQRRENVGLVKGIPFDTLLGDRLDELNAKKLEPVDAVPTPLPTWDRVCRDEGGGVGLARGWHIALGAPTGRGKSLAGLNMAAKAVRAGEHVLYVSAEMSQQQLATRFQSIFAGINIRRLEHGSEFSEADARTAATELKGMFDRTGGYVRVNRTPITDLQAITKAISREYDEHGCRFVIVDYFQLCWDAGAQNPLDQITRVSHTIRDLAARLGLITVGLSQMNRETAKNTDAPPSPHGLLGGSALENDADQVVLLDHTKEQRTLKDNRTQVIVAKNRHGPQVRIPVRWDYQTLRLTEESDRKEEAVSGDAKRIV